MDRFAFDETKSKQELQDAWQRQYPDKPLPTHLQEGKTMAEEDGRPSRAYLTRLYDELKTSLGAGEINPDVFNAAHRKALASAGGTAAAKNRAAKKDDAIADLEADSLDPIQMREHFAKHPEPIAGCEMCGMNSGTPLVLLPKSDPRVNYRKAQAA